MESVIITRPGDRIDILAYKYLGDQKYYLALMEANPRFDPLDIKSSVELNIPNAK